MRTLGMDEVARKITNRHRARSFLKCEVSLCEVVQNFEDILGVLIRYHVNCGILLPRESQQIQHIDAAGATIIRPEDRSKTGPTRKALLSGIPEFWMLPWGSKKVSRLVGVDDRSVRKIIFPRGTIFGVLKINLGQNHNDSLGFCLFQAEVQKILILP